MNDASTDPDGGGRVRIADRPPHFSFARSHFGAAAAPLALGLALSILAGGCRPRGGEETVTASPARPLSDALAAHTPDLMKLPGVVGTAESRLGDGRPCILVMVVRLTPELERRIPQAIEGWPVKIEETGEIRAMPDSGR